MKKIKQIEKGLFAEHVTLFIAKILAKIIPSVQNIAYVQGKWHVHAFQCGCHVTRVLDIQHCDKVNRFTR